MPDDPNLFADDDFWSEGLPGSDESGSGARPPWETHPGDPAAALEAPPAEQPPWQQHPGAATPSQSAPDQSAPWRAHPGATPPPMSGGQPAEPAWGESGWSAQSVAGETAPSDELPQGLTGTLPWRSADQPAQAGVPSNAEDAGWLDTFGQTGYDANSPLPQDDGDLSWLASESGFTAEPVEPSGDAAADADAGAEELLWPDDDLFAALSTDDASAPPEERSPSGLLRRLSPAAPPSEEVPAALDQPDLTIDDLFDSAFGDDFEEAPAASEPGSADISGTTDEGDLGFWAEDDPLTNQAYHEPLFEELLAEEPPASEPPAVMGDVPEWLRAQAAPPSAPLAWEDEPTGEPAGDEELPGWAAEGASYDAQGVASELSYDEWEQAEIAREQEAAKTEEDRLLEEVPEWLDQPTPAAPPSVEEPTGPEFVPDWFSGLEAQDMEAAPDWFQKLDYTADPLAAPSSEPEPAPPVASDAQMPDWLRTDSLMDLGAMDDVPLTDAQPPAEEWAGDEPLPDEMDFLNRLGEPSGSAASGHPTPPAPPGISSHDDEWMRTFAPAVPPTPETPQSSVQPPVEDFVERFDPFTPGEPGASAEPGAFVEPASLGADFGADNLDWLQEISAEDLIERAPAPPVEESAPPPVPAAEADEDTLFGEPMVDSQAIDDLLGISDSSMALAMPEELPTVAPQEASFEWPEDDPWLALEQAEAAASSQAPAGEEPLFNEDALEDFFAAGESAPDAFADEPYSVPETPVAPAAPATPSPSIESPATARESAQPQWLQEMRPSDLPVTLAAGGVRLDMTQRNLEDLPDTLRALHQRLGDEQAFADATRDMEPRSDTGPLADIPDSLPAIPAALPTIRREAVIEGLVISADEQRRVEKLQAVLDLLAAEEDEAEEAPGEGFSFSTPSPFDFGGEEVDQEAVAVAEMAVKPRPRRPHTYKFDRLVIVLALFAAIIVPFITDVAHFAADPLALAGDQAAVAQAVDALQAGDIVLVALEYGPTAAGELDALAEAVLRDVAARRAVPVMISTNPSAALHAEAVIAPLRDDAALLKARGNAEASLTAGEDYVLLAYLPGEAVGVRSLVQGTGDEGTVHPAFDIDLRGEETALAVHDIAADVALIVVVSEDSTAVRTWAEQLESVAIPKVALVTAVAEALTEPYVQDDGYVGYLAGVRDTYSYNAARNATTREMYSVPDGISFDMPNPETSRWHSMALGAAAAAAVIALGLAVNLIRALGRRRSR